MRVLRARQQGVSFLGFIIILAVAGFFAFLGMKIFPAYSEYYNVVSAMEQIAREPGSARWSPAEILTSLEKRMYINYVDEKNVNKRSFQIKRAGTGYTLSVKYERREPLLYNLDYVAKFERVVQIGTNSSDQN
ncbi:MAG: DUF4845 domain-containing protein [Xanthomonadales bacterium]|nr:DUF4845 domain-containing protein [Xanthomonadales bacterium]